MKKKPEKRAAAPAKSVTRKGTRPTAPARKKPVAEKQKKALRTAAKPAAVGAKKAPPATVKKKVAAPLRRQPPAPAKKPAPAPARKAAPAPAKKALPARSGASAPAPAAAVAKSAVSSVMLKELATRALADDAKISHEKFMDFLSENNLLPKKKEISAHLASLDIRILKKKSALSQEKIGEYNNFLTNFQKELKAILKRVKKGLGVIETSAINYIFGGDETVRKNQKYIKHFLKENEIKPFKGAAKKPAKAGGERSEIVGDPVRQYLREMGSVNLLSRNEEISIARKIERGEKKVIKAMERSL